jgi:hypothetical protein
MPTMLLPNGDFVTSADSIFLRLNTDILRIRRKSKKSVASFVQRPSSWAKITYTIATVNTKTIFLSNGFSVNTVSTTIRQSRVWTDIRQVSASHWRAEVESWSGNRNSNLTLMTKTKSKLNRL